MKENDIAIKIIESAIEVRKFLDKGLLKDTYEDCIIYELEQRKLKFEKNTPFPIVYKNITVKEVYLVNLIVEGKVLVFIQTNKIDENDLSKMKTILQLKELKLGLIINFNTNRILEGIERVVNGYL